MARNKGTFKFAATLEVQAANALDPRGVVNTKAELINKETWPYEGETIYVYNCMQVAVVEEKAVYMLIDPSKILESDYSGWKKIDASAATVVEVIDNLLSTNPNAALSANQGKILDDKISALSTKLTSIFKFKGSKDNLDAIQAIESPETGDVYHNSANGGEYVYDGTQWELLGLSIDLEPYAKTVDVTSAINTAKEELSSTITATTADLQSKIDTKVATEAGKSLVADTLIDQITQNKTDIASLTTTVGGLTTNLADYKVKSVDRTASNGVALELSEAGVLKVTADVSALATKESVDTISTKVENLTANLKVKDVNTTASNGVSLSLTDGTVGVSVDVATLTPKVKENLNLKANEVKISAAIGGTTDAPNYAADSTVQAVLSGMDSRIKANADSIKAAVAGGVTAIKPGYGIEVDTTGEGGTTQPTVKVKVNEDSNIRATESGLDLVWLE